MLIVGQVFIHGFQFRTADFEDRRANHDKCIRQSSYFCTRSAHAGGRRFGRILSFHQVTLSAAPWSVPLVFQVTLVDFFDTTIGPECGLSRYEAANVERRFLLATDIQSRAAIAPGDGPRGSSFYVFPV